MFIFKRTVVQVCKYLTHVLVVSAAHVTIQIVFPIVDGGRETSCPQCTLMSQQQRVLEAGEGWRNVCCQMKR